LGGARGWGGSGCVCEQMNLLISFIARDHRFAGVLEPLNAKPGIGLGFAARGARAASAGLPYALDGWT